MMLGTALRRADWLDAGRVRAYLRLFAVAYVAFLMAWAVHDRAIAALGSKPLAHDFVAFWSAGRLSLEGQAPAAYDNVRLRSTEAAAAILPGGALPFYYPPPFLLICAPLALLPFLGGLLVFLCGEFALLFGLLRAMHLPGKAWLAMLVWPGLLLAALAGQNTPLTAACFAGAMIWVERQPALAGACLGALVCKPQFALGVPLVLLAARRVKALLACAGTAASLCLLSWLVFGGATWQAFFAFSPHAFAQIAFDPVAWHKMQSLFATLRLAGIGLGTAYAAQACLSVASCLAILWLARQRPGGGAEMAFLSAASLLLSPYLYYYDLAVLAVPAAWLVCEAHAIGWRAWEKVTLLGLFLLPLLALAASHLLDILVGPLFVVVFMMVLARRMLPGAAEPTRQAGAW